SGEDAVKGPALANGAPAGPRQRSPRPYAGPRKHERARHLGNGGLSSCVAELLVSLARTPGESGQHAGRSMGAAPGRLTVRTAPQPTSPPYWTRRLRTISS